MNLTQGGRGPVLVQVDPKCIHSALREFLQPLKTNNPRADFFATYRKESEVFDNEYAKKYDEDLNTSLIFAGLFSAVSSVFIIDVQAKSGPDPNQLAATYMQVLIHTLNGSLYPNVDPPPTAWPGPDEGVVIVQCLLYASLATSLFAAFVAMLGKQWLNRFVRNKGRTAAEKSWDRQNKLRGMEKWHFHIVMESLPIMLQFALLLLGSSISGYLWYRNRIVATVVLSVTASGVIFYLLFTIAGSLCYECPYQTPMSLIIRIIVPSLSPRVPLVPSVTIPFMGPFSWLLTRLDRIFRSIKSVIRRVPAFTLVLRHNPSVVDEVIIVPAPLFGDKLVNWQQHKEDSKCVLWTMDTSADADVLLFAFRCAADIVWYPEIATLLCSRRVAALFFDCFLDGAVIPGAEERASYLARILTSILNIHACMGYNLEATHQIGEGICSLQWEHEDPDVYIAWWSLTLTFHEQVLCCPPLRKDTSPGFCIWLSQMILQSIHWRQAKRDDKIYSIVEFGDPMGQLVRGKRVPNAVFSNLVLTCAVSLGLRLNITDLHISDNSYLTLRIALKQLSERIMVAIADPLYDEEHIRGVLRFLRLWIGAEFKDLAEYCMPWVEAILDSGRPVSERYQIAGAALQLLEDQPNPSLANRAFRRQDDRCAKVALRYLALHYSVSGLYDDPSLSLYPAAATVALQIVRGLLPTQHPKRTS